MLDFLHGKTATFEQLFHEMGFYNLVFQRQTKILIDLMDICVIEEID